MDEREQLERALDRELKRLPEIAAPEALTRRVMDRVRAMDAVAWWRRSWFEWPPALRGATAALAAGWLIGLGLLDWRAANTAMGEVLLWSGGVVDFGVGLLDAVPWVVWMLLAAIGAVSWFTLLGASVVFWRLAKVRR